MSKNKKKVRNLKYISLRKEEQAPKIGSFIEEKDTLIAQKISDENVSLFMTDQNGKVMQAVGSQDEAVAMVSKPMIIAVKAESEAEALELSKGNPNNIYYVIEN